MDLLPYDTHGCAMCGFQAANPSDSARFRFCSDDSKETVTSIGGQKLDVGCGLADPHLHRQCVRCGYQWLTETAPAVQVQVNPEPAIRAVAHELTLAAQALEVAAETFKNARATPMDAQRAKTAATRAKQAADALVHA